ncbi:MAG: hypothetical protein HOE90_14050 [Bacteriovoracaceae bacterium]|nr:hypothetical protein [Bacteriovoracaceae bacterium]
MVKNRVSKIIDRIRKERGEVAEIHHAFRDFPEAMEAHFEFYQKIIVGDNLPLERIEREFLAVSTSEANKCPYCIGHHQKALDNIGEIDLPSEKKEIYRKLAQTLSSEPHKSHLLKKEFNSIHQDESAWQHAVFIVSYFNMANRLAFAMDLELEENFHKSCH